ncbi:aldose epimerase family protein [Portibacter marinus]|uniref:aldose epimerase family protein n=1 Tax=Portibacter marinus TaxID=2898660 RepID=UPI001F296A34|nr:aldose epimerase family protein [Portibacter marinus]
MIIEEAFGQSKKFTLENKNGVEVTVLNYGGIIQSILTPDQNGLLADITLGFDQFEDYLKGHPYFGAIIGRYGNRIEGGRFELDGKIYKLATNSNGNHLHGGEQGFDKKFWHSEVENEKLILTYRSPHMEEGYPGNLDVKVSYELNDENALILTYEAATDQATPISLTNHAYFNLAGSGDVLEHRLMINASYITPVNRYIIPLGHLQEVADTPFDFRSMKAIGQDIDSPDEQLEFGGGYDHNFVLDQPGIQYLAAKVLEPQSGRVLEVHTDEPGIQLYTGNWLEGHYNGKFQQNYGKRTGFCLETQHFPDSPNQSNFPSVIIKPGELFRSQTIYKFGVRSVDQ